MTIALGTKFEHRGTLGALVCADSRATCPSDWSTNFGKKGHLSVSAGVRGCAIAIVEASEDANAAEMLSYDITNALRGNLNDNGMWRIREIVTEVMTNWRSHYGEGKAPGMEFVLAVGKAGNCELLYCSPPNTVLDKGTCFGVGTGSRATEPLMLPLQVMRLPTAESAILRTGYWIHRAKRDEGAFVGGNSPIYLVTQWGRMAMVHDSSEIEAFGGKVDELVNRCRYQILTHESEKAQQKFLAELNNQYLELPAEIRRLAVPQLDWLEGKTNEDTIKQLSFQK